MVEKVVNGESKVYMSINKVKIAKPMLDDVETFSKFLIKENNNEMKLYEVIDTSRYRSLKELIIVRSYVVRFFKNLTSKVKRNNDECEAK